MFIFLFILVAGLVLIYANVSPVAPGKKGKLIALGILVSILAGTPVGSTIVAADVLCFGICCIAGKIVKA